MKFRKKPIVVDAIRWFPRNDLGQFHKGKYRNHKIGTDKHGVEYLICEVGLHTKEGFMKIKPGDWIVTGIKGERYAVDGEIFAATYEKCGI